MALQETLNGSPQVRQLRALQQTATSKVTAGSLGGSGVVQRFTDEQMAAFQRAQIARRSAEVAGVGGGFVMHGAVQPGPHARGALGLMRSRFDLSGVGDEHQDSVEHAISGVTRSGSQNRLAVGVGMDLFGRMLRNVGRLRHDNFVRDLANQSGNPLVRPFAPLTNPNRAVGAEPSRLNIGTNLATAPHYDPATNSVSLMNPGQMDQTGHELQHASDHIHGDLDLANPDHRLASELNAFTTQDAVSQETTGAGPRNFEDRTPSEMARSYHGKDGYPGTLDSSLASGAAWRARRDRR
jgi:hypothetical protein